jgi:predicted Zn-dependent protease
MPGFFYRLGKKVGPQLRKGNWILQALTGEESDLLEAEHKVGRDMAAQIRETMPGPATPEHDRAEGWVGEIGRSLSARVKEKRRRFTIGVVASGEPNAFALPGGFLFVERSLLDLCQWERDEAAFVVAHEMAHVIRGHAMERLLGSDVIAAAARTAIRGAGPYGLLVRQAAMQFLQTAYSREQEFDADDLGFRLAVAAGFDASGGPRLLGRLRTFSQSPDASDLGTYFATHPPFDERIARLRARVARLDAR